MNIQQLSERIAELYGTHASEFLENTYYTDCHHEIWLVSDWNRLMPLAVENDIDIEHYFKQGYVGISSNLEFSTESYADHPSKEAATQVAIARALIAIKE